MGGLAFMQVQESFWSIYSSARYLFVSKTVLDTIRIARNTAMTIASDVKSCHECTDAHIPLLVTNVANMTSMNETTASIGARNLYSP